MNKIRLDLVEKSKEIVGYEDYGVTACGNVVRLKRGPRGPDRGYHLKPSNNVWGYPTVGLRGPSGHKTFFVHRLVCMAFLPCPGEFRDYQVNHIDGVKTNNNLSNLEWSTGLENIRHAIEVLKVDRAHRGEDNNKAKITEQDVLHIREIAGAIKYTELAKTYNLSASQIGVIRRGDGWTHLKYENKPLSSLNRLSRKDVINIRKDYFNNLSMSRKQIATKYNQSTSYIARILDNRVWRNAR